MRILHVLDHSLPLHSGYTFRTRAILHEQHKLGWETFHITSPKHPGSGALEETIEGLHFFRTPPNGTWWAGGPALKQLAIVTELAARLSDVVAQVRPAILHAHSPVLNALAALKLSRRRGIPLVYEVRAFWEDAAVDHGTSRAGGPRYRLTRALETYALRRAAAVTTICEGLRQDIIKRGIAPEKVTVIPNAVDVEQFQARHAPDPALRRELGLLGARVLGFIGSFYTYEGLALLLEALPLVLAQAPDSRLLLVGGGPQEPALRAQVQALGLSGKVIFTGRVPHREIQRYYDLIDVLVYPRLSLRLTELVTPLKPLEAMAQQRLCIASDVGGHRELIRDGETGILFRAGSSADLAAKAIALLQSPERWPGLKKAARRFVESERTWAASVARYRQVYGGLLRGAP